MKNTVLTANQSRTCVSARDKYHKYLTAVYQPSSIKSKQNYADRESQQVRTGKDIAEARGHGPLGTMGDKDRQWNRGVGSAMGARSLISTSHMAEFEAHGSCQGRQLIKR